jgi:hypothetical protein
MAMKGVLMAEQLSKLIIDGLVSPHSLNGEMEVMVL